MYFEVHKNNQYQQPYWWVIKSKGNHAKLAHSEMFSTKANCIHSMMLVKNNTVNTVWYDKTGE